MSSQGNKTFPVIVIHGGALPSAIPNSPANPYLIGVKAAALRGYSVLSQQGGRAIDAVEAAVRLLEDDQIFNAGTGSRLNEDGDIEMDACIMDGDGLKSGAVAAVKNIRNPIALARLVMDKTEHVLLAGEGANRFATRCGVPSVGLHSLVSDSSQEKLIKWKKDNQSLSSTTTENCIDHDTVGAVAIDSEGHVACATSTGGITGKMVGRVGDSPLVGPGSYADDSVGAVSTTGHGESIITVCLGFRIVQSIEKGLPVQEAVTKSLEFMFEHVGSCGGAIAVDRCGNVGLSFTTERMPWAFIRDGELHYGFELEEHQKEVAQL